eukprot:Polyplicarium_translucidae@DN1864_c0_g1_i1.p3
MLYRCRGSTKSHCPRLDPGTYVLCEVGDDLRSWTDEPYLGVIPRRGYVFTISLPLASCMMDCSCFIPDEVGRRFKFEMAVGANGLLWVDGGTPRKTVLIGECLRRSIGLDAAEFAAHTAGHATAKKPRSIMQWGPPLAPSDGERVPIRRTR